jgi:hypothetical protein
MPQKATKETAFVPFYNNETIYEIPQTFIPKEKAPYLRF